MSEEKEYSGRFSVRVPKSLHKDLAERAKKERCSLNHLIVYILSQHEKYTEIPEETHHFEIEKGCSCGDVTCGKYLDHIKKINLETPCIPPNTRVAFRPVGRNVEVTGTITRVAGNGDRDQPPFRYLITADNEQGMAWCYASRIRVLS